MPQRSSLFLALFLIVFADLAISQVPADLKTRAETSNFEETSRCDDVMAFIAKLQKRSPLVKVANFGTTVDGRKMPLMILSDPPFPTPAEARGAGKPIIFIMDNIHAGEAEGKRGGAEYRPPHPVWRGIGIYGQSLRVALDVFD